MTKEELIKENEDLKLIILNLQDENEMLKQLLKEKYEQDN